jgi:hypothetical protein
MLPAHPWVRMWLLCRGGTRLNGCLLRGPSLLSPPLFRPPLPHSLVGPGIALRTERPSRTPLCWRAPCREGLQHVRLRSVSSGASISRLPHAPPKPSWGAHKRRSRVLGRLGSPGGFLRRSGCARCKCTLRDISPIGLRPLRQSSRLRAPAQPLLRTCFCTPTSPQQTFITA